MHTFFEVWCSIVPKLFPIFSGILKFQYILSQLMSLKFMKNSRKSHAEIMEYLRRLRLRQNDGLQKV